MLSYAISELCYGCRESVTYEYGKGMNCFSKVGSKMACNDDPSVDVSNGSMIPPSYGGRKENSWMKQGRGK